MPENYSKEKKIRQTQSEKKKKKKEKQEKPADLLFSILIEHMRKTMNISSSANGYSCEI